MTDNGKSMTEEVKIRAGEPFFTNKEVGEGTGLGLATCYGIIAQSGGVMGISSEVGEGTTFNIYLPIRGTSNMSKIREQVKLYVATGNETILLVEDEPSVRRALAAVLTDSGYRVIEASKHRTATKR